MMWSTKQPIEVHTAPGLVRLYNCKTSVNGSRNDFLLILCFCQFLINLVVACIMSSGDIPSTSSTLPPVLCRLSVGHHAEKMPEKIGSRTHRWKVFVRAPEGYPEFTDRSFIRKVTFKLHKTFDNPERVVRKPPFGEFFECF